MKKFYIISIKSTKTGIGAIANRTISHIAYAIDNGFIPIVDLKHLKNIYFKDGREYKDNVWEYFFKQPCKYTLETIPDDADIEIIDNVEQPAEYNLLPVNLPIANTKDKNFLQNRQKQLKNLLQFSEDMQIFVEDKYKQIIGSQTNILGILCRGSDHTDIMPKNHPIQPNSTDVICKAKKLKNILNWEKIFLATEDKRIYESFKKEFGEDLLDNSQFRFEKVNKWLGEIIPENIKNFHYNIAKEYLASLYILSKCRYFIGGRTGGTAMLFNLPSTNWEYYYIWNLGYYEKVTVNSLFKKLFS